MEKTKKTITIKSSQKKNSQVSQKKLPNFVLSKDSTIPMTDPWDEEVYLPLDPKTMKNEGFQPPNIWVITPKNEGCGFPCTY